MSASVPFMGGYAGGTIRSVGGPMKFGIHNSSMEESLTLGYSSES